MSMKTSPSLLGSSLPLLACVVALSFGTLVAQAAPFIYYASTSSSVESVDAVTGDAGPIFASNLFLGAQPGAARNIQIDNDDRLLWYFDTSGNLRSVRMTDRTAGPTITAGVFRGANEGADRHFSIDPVRNLVYFSATDGTVQIVSTDSGTETGLIPSGRFNGGIVGGFRHTAIDPVNNIMYYASTDNAIYSFYLDNFKDGPKVPSSSVRGAAAGAFRHFVYNPATRLIHYVATDDAIHSVNPITLAVGPTVSSNAIQGAAVGAGRPIGIDAPVSEIDDNPPKVTVKNGMKITTSKKSITLRGKAVDLNFVTAVRYKINGGALQNATGGKKWSFPVKLKKGRNKVVISATDFALNRSKNVTVIINRK